MARVYRVKFTRKVSNKIEAGFEMQVTPSGGSEKPSRMDIIRALEDHGINLGGTDISGSYIIDKI